jgi:uncharacterized membrane protein
MLLAPRTRRIGAYATAILFVAVFPANVQMAIDGGYAEAGFPANNATLAWLRLPLQVPLVCWALSFRKEGATLPAGPRCRTRVQETRQPLPQVDFI